MRIIKVKQTRESKVYIEYERINARGEYDTFTMCCGDEPAASFIESFEALRPHALALLELDEEETRLIIKGVSFSYSGDDDIMGATIIGARKLYESNTDMNFTTPHKFESYTSGGEDGDPRQLLSSECVSALRTVQEEALRYIDGHRAQLSLDFASN